jgi:hypothetical protein
MREKNEIFLFIVLPLSFIISSRESQPDGNGWQEACRVGRIVLAKAKMESKVA